MNISREGKIVSTFYGNIVRNVNFWANWRPHEYAIFKVLLHKVVLEFYTLFRIFKSSFRTRKIVFIIFICIFLWEILAILNGLKYFLRKKFDKNQGQEKYKKKKLSKVRSNMRFAHIKPKFYSIKAELQIWLK